jgi:hypothetical protein
MGTPNYPYIKRVIVVNPLSIRLQLYEEMERRMINGVIFEGLKYDDINTMLVILQPMVNGIPIRKK